MFVGNKVRPGSAAATRRLRGQATHCRRVEFEEVAGPDPNPLTSALDSEPWASDCGRNRSARNWQKGMEILNSGNGRLIRVLPENSAYAHPDIPLEPAYDQLRKDPWAGPHLARKNVATDMAA